MANPKGRTDAFNRDLLDDGVLRPVPASPAPSAEPAEAAAHDAALARLRAEIQIGLDDYAAGRFYEVTSAEDLFNRIMSDEDDDAADEAAQDFSGGRS